MSKGKTVQLHRVGRPGEGSKLTVMQHMRSADGASSVTVDMLQAQVPDRRYVANCGTVLRSGDLFRLVFAQSKTSSAGLRSVIDVQMMKPAVATFLGALDSIQTKLAPHQSNSMDLLDSFDEPAQAVGLAANVVPVAFSDAEACMDFYQMSAFMLSSLGSSGDVFAEPVVRVTLPTGLFVALVDRLRVLATEGS